MTKIKTCLLIITYCLNITLAANTNQNNLDIKTWELDSGMKVAFVAEHNNIVNIKLAFDAGASRDSNSYGIANMTSNLLELGSKGLTAKEIAENFESVGAIFASSTYKDFVVLSLQTLAATKYFDPATTTFIKVASSPAFPAAEITRIKDHTITQIKLQNENPQTLAFHKFFASAYNNHPYGHATSGNENTIHAITTAQINDFYNNHYTSANATLVIVGDLSFNDAKNLATKINNALPAGTKLQPIKMAKLNQGGKNNIAYPSQQSSLVFGHVAISPNNQDHYALTLAEYILGGGMDSRLSSVIREQKGLVYNVSSFFIPLKARGPFIVMLQTKAESTADATNATTPVITDFVNSGVSTAELATAKNVIVSTYFDKFTTNNKIANAIMRQLIYNMPQNYLNNYATNINAVTLDEINIAIKKHILLANSSYVTVGPQIITTKVEI
jgi:zinc protease